MTIRLSSLFCAALLGLAACGPQSAPDIQETEADPLEIIPMPSAPLDPGKAVTRIAFGSCNGQWADQDIFDAIAATEPDLFLYIGDNVYADPFMPDVYATITLDDGTVLTNVKVDSARQAGPEYIAKAYRDLADSRPFERLREATPVLATWDDHDYGLNDAGAEWEHKATAQQMFLDAYGFPADDPRRSRDGVYSSYMLGPDGQRLQIILLDARSFRSPFRVTDERGVEGKERYLPDPDPSKTMLGEAQWAWLEAELRKPADLRLIASSLQVVADGHGWEAWRMLPAERQRFYDLIDETGADRVFVISGDRHIGALYREEDAAPYPLYDLTSSSLNLPSRNNDGEPGPKRLGDIYNVANFGLIEIDWGAQAVAFELRDENGGVLLGQFAPFSEMQGAIN